jgi:hypothetical protein
MLVVQHRKNSAANPISRSAFLEALDVEEGSRKNNVLLYVSHTEQVEDESDRRQLKQVSRDWRQFFISIYAQEYMQIFPGLLPENIIFGGYLRTRNCEISLFV